MKNKVIIALIFVFSLLFVGNVYAENSVHIESVTLDSKSETISLAEAKYEGLSVNLDVKFDNGTIEADGYMKWPKNYKMFKNDIDELFNSLRGDKNGKDV